jgi:hypothetical protein
MRRENLLCIHKNHILNIQRQGLVLTLFKGEKTPIFWAGLLLVSFALWVMFANLWSELTYANWWDAIIHYSFPFIIGAVVFVLIGLVMMKSGVKGNKPA